MPVLKSAIISSACLAVISYSTYASNALNTQEASEPRATILNSGAEHKTNNARELHGIDIGDVVDEDELDRLARAANGEDDESVAEAAQQQQLEVEGKLDILRALEVRRIAELAPRVIIPEVARGYEDIYLRLLRGVLVYSPNPGSEVGKIEMRVSDLANPLEEAFDLSRFGDVGQYLSIATGYRKSKKAENASKIEIWITPWFLIKEELLGSASHFANIMGSWDPRTAPVGIFFTWGGYDILGWYEYLTTEGMDECVNTNFYEKWVDSNCAWGEAACCARPSLGPPRPAAVDGGAQMEKISFYFRD